jgi:precorrin-3B C17-methyltransferase
MGTPSVSEAAAILAAHSDMSGLLVEKFLLGSHHWVSSQLATRLHRLAQPYHKHQYLVRLDEMAECDIGMLTTVLIGNSSTFIKAGLMITPRGYANKYNSLTGATKEGEQAGVSLSMGLEGWYACLRQYVQDNPGLTLEKIADYFGVVMGEVLAAIAAGESAGEHKAARVAQDKLNDVVSACQSWGRLRGIIRAEAGAVSELFLQAQDFQLRGDWLNIETDAFHCHINWSKVAAAYLASRDDKSYGVNFIDNKGHLVFRLLMMKEKGEFSANQLATYTQAWQALVGGIKQ